MGRMPLWPCRQQRVVLVAVRVPGSENDLGHWIPLHRHRVDVAPRDRPVLEQDELVGRERDRTHVGMALAIQHRGRGSIVGNLAERQRITGVESLEGVDAGRQQAHREDRLAAVHGHHPPRQVPRVHQAPVTDDRQTRLEVVEVGEPEQQVPVLMGDHGVERAVVAVLVDGLGEEEAIANRAVRSQRVVRIWSAALDGVGKDQAIGVRHPEREGRDVLGTVLEHIALKVASGVHDEQAVVPVPGDRIAKRLGLRVGGQEELVEHRDGGRIDARSERPRSVVRHVAHLIGLHAGPAGVARPDLALDVHRAVALHVVVAAQGFEVILIELSIVRRPVDARCRVAGVAEIEAPVARGLAPSAIGLELDADQRHLDHVRRSRWTPRPRHTRARPAQALERRPHAAAPAEVRHPLPARMNDEIREAPPAALALALDLEPGARHRGGALAGRNRGRPRRADGRCLAGQTTGRRRCNGRCG